MLTIDDSRTRDMDDAVEVIATFEGWIVRVAIADASRLVKPGSDLDVAARARGATKYFAYGNSPMLPREISDWKLSLWPAREKKTINAEIVLSPTLEVVSKTFSHGKITSKAKLSYDMIPGILADAENPFHKEISDAHKLATGLMTKRRNEGALIFYDLNNGWVSTEEGSLKQLKQRADTVGYIIIQELMILANVATATYMAENNIPTLFRNHEARAAAPDRAVIQRQISEAFQTPVLDLETLQKRTHILFERAAYGATLLGHYGLNQPAYVHFTSPIRRYADLVVHQQLRAHLKGEPLPYTQEQLAETAQHLNDLAQKARDESSAHFKGKAEDRARRQVSARALESLPARDFERVVKVEIKDGGDPSEALAEAWGRKIADDTIPLICLTIVLTDAGQTEGWDMLKVQAMQFLTRRPHDAVSVWAYGEERGWPEVGYQSEAEGPAHAPIFTCTATASNGIGVTAQARVAKEARQWATVKLIGLVTGIPVNVPSPAPLAAQAAPKAKPVDTSRNPVSVLMEHSQATKVQPPQFNFSFSGPAHAPVVKCVGTFIGHEVEVSASNKQEAKTLAAKALVGKL